MALAEATASGGGSRAEGAMLSGIVDGSAADATTGPAGDAAGDAVPSAFFAAAPPTEERLDAAMRPSIEAPTTAVPAPNHRHDRGRDADAMRLASDTASSTWAGVGPSSSLAATRCAKSGSS
ncbi:MAG: hypothetical protein KF782_12150 [Labilithrix sp.]|nr:hypothetical protein [Labilithrix sp.]